MSVINSTYSSEAKRCFGQNGPRHSRLTYEKFAVCVARHVFGPYVIAAAKPHTTYFAWHHMGQQRGKFESVKRI